MKVIISGIVENTPNCPPPKPQIRTIQIRGTYPREDRHTDLMLRTAGNFRYLLVLENTFFEWIEFSGRTKQQLKQLRSEREIIPRFGLPGSLQQMMVQDLYLK